MKAKNVYTRKISNEETSESYILVLKNKLTFFPPIRKQFSIMQGEEERKAKVESYSCNCRGPDAPHEHYFIRWKGLKAKDKVEIKKDSIKEETYIMKIQL